MTDLIVPRGDTFPRAFLDTYRASRNSEIYNISGELTSSKSDELVLQNPSDIPMVEDMRHGHSEDLLDSGCMSPTTENFLDKSDIVVPKAYRKRASVYDRVDPEDSIRDIVSENDFYRFVLFKKHYDKYLHLSQKYEEARNIAYYLEEKYHEVMTERDDLMQQRQEYAKKLESNESLLREKEDEVFVNLERVVYLEEQCDKLRAEKDKCMEQKSLIEQERDATLRLLKEQARESEYTRRKLERARQEVVHHLTKMKNEKEFLERQNDELKEQLEAERMRLRYPPQVRRRRTDACDFAHRNQTTERKSSNTASSTLASQFQKAVEHLATCKQKKCQVCAYTKSTYRKMSPSHHNKKIFSCLQTPFFEMRNMIKPPRSPIRGAEGESLSEWFCPVQDMSPSCSAQSDCSSLSMPFAELTISYMDDVSDRESSSSYNTRDKEDGMSSQDNRNSFGNSFRGFGSDSGFSSDICADFKSNTTTPKQEKFSHKATLDEQDCQKLTRTKWTASFRKIIRKIRK